ncbi:MAG: ATP-dependent sacrificial sulfur transferase LarE [Desulfobacteraceae bacterium]|nr:ATP-dependent sacrificial sulfur transferase LarE [Desulfobacteraceae bacterium]
MIHSDWKEITPKYEHLQDILMDMKEVLVAFSGGTDSTLLLKVAKNVLKEKVLAVTALSETVPEHEKADAQTFARAFDVPHLWITSEELKDPDFIKNPKDKCYICKKLRFGELVRMARKKRIPWVADGENEDDKTDYRPGSIAARELGVRSPLREAGLTKAQIRFISKELHLSSWNKPSCACLASRIPYHQPITARKLKQVDAAETFIRTRDLSRQVRVRHEGDTARIEVEIENIHKFMETHVREQIVIKFKSLGFKFIALDLEGYSTGSMNRVINSPKNQGE